MLRDAVDPTNKPGAWPDHTQNLTVRFCLARAAVGIRKWDKGEQLGCCACTALTDCWRRALAWLQLGAQLSPGNKAGGDAVEDAGQQGPAERLPVPVHGLVAAVLIAAEADWLEGLRPLAGHVNGLALAHPICHIFALSREAEGTGLL